MLERGRPESRLVSSWNEWAPLEEVVVGIADGACFSPVEPGHRPSTSDIGQAPRLPWPRGPMSAGAVDAASRQLEGLVDVLRAEGIIVRRPTPLPFDAPVQTPAFRVETMQGATCPRDVMITIGAEILEASMARRARFFEYLAYRDLALRYFRSDLRSAWTAAPKPSMREGMYRSDFWSRGEEEEEEAGSRPGLYEYVLAQDEPAFDAADIVRFGRDLFVQESMTTNRTGIEWLRRHLGARGLRVHAVHFPNDRRPMHIDCSLVPLRPGLVLMNPSRPLAEGEEALFVANGWEIVMAPEPAGAADGMPAFCQCSVWLSMNILSLSPSVVVVEEREKPLIRLLKGMGFRVLDVPFRNVYELGGGLHCATWDIRRTGECEDYFPKQIG